MKKIILAGMVLIIVVVVPFLWIQLARPSRTPLVRVLENGAVYQRIIWDEPNVVAHVVRVDLKQSAVSYQVTPSGADGLFTPLKTSAFLRSFRSDVAINGSFYQEDRATGLLWPLGQVIADGEVLVNGRTRYPTLCVLPGQRLQITSSDNCPAHSVHGLAGNVLAVDNGAPLDSRATRYPGRGNAFRPQPRTAVALDESGTQLWLVVVDGRQPSYSVGMTMDQLAAFLVELGAHTAINLDGGGSSTLVTQSWRGPLIRNSPIHNGIPTLQRPVPTHLGVTLGPREPINAD